MLGESLNVVIAVMIMGLAVGVPIICALAEIAICVSRRIASLRAAQWRAPHAPVDLDEHEEAIR